MENEMMYQLSIQPAKTMLEKGIISKKEWRQIKKYFIEKYQPIIPTLLAE